MIKIPTLNMSSDEIAANLQAVINEICKHRPLDFGTPCGMRFPL